MSLRGLDYVATKVNWVHSGCSGGRDVSWSIRMNICLGVARGLHHLHTHYLAFAEREKESWLSSEFYHGDVNARTILLDHNLEPKVSNLSALPLWPDLVFYKETAVVGSRQVFGVTIVLFHWITGMPTCTFLCSWTADLLVVICALLVVLHVR